MRQNEISLPLDHIVIAVKDLDRAIRDYQALGFTVIHGGKYSNYAIHSAFIFFSDGTYMELMAENEDEKQTDVDDFSAMMRQGEGLAGFALRTSDMDVEARRLQNTGFEIGNISTINLERDGKLIQWKLSVIDNGFKPFLVQDITPHEWRIPTDVDMITHRNQAVGMAAVEFVVRNMNDTWRKYTRLMNMTPQAQASNYRQVGNIILNEYIELHSHDTHPIFLKLFGVMYSQEEMDKIDIKREPDAFTRALDVQAQMLTHFRSSAEREKVMDSALADEEEVLFAVHLIRASANQDNFTLERTHGVHFHHLTGVPANYGMTILKGLDDVDWASIRHAYGPASDVPDLLRALVSDNLTVREQAHYKLMSSIVHQGTVYEASVEAIPFLVQLVDSPLVDNEAPLNLLQYIPLGGLDSPELCEQTREKLRIILPSLIRNLSHSDIEVRKNMASLLAHYPDDAELLSPLLKEHIKNDSAPEVRASCLRSLAHIWTGLWSVESERVLTEQQQRYIRDIMREFSYPMVVRFEAAIILVGNHADTWLDEATVLFYKIMEPDIQTLREIEIFSIFYHVLRVLKPYPKEALQWISVQAKHPYTQVREQIGNAIHDLTQDEENFSKILPTLHLLLDDKSPSVRQSTVSLFSNSPYAVHVQDKLRDLAENDSSFAVRAIARNTLNTLQ